MLALLSLVEPIAAIAGTWHNVTFEISPTSAAVLPNGNLLLWSADGPGSFGASAAHGTWTTLVDVDGTALRQNKRYNDLMEMFCTGITQLPDGNILINGGSNNQAVAKYDWKTDVFAPMNSMQTKRGYQANVLTTNNLVFTIGGSWGSPRGGRNGELYWPRGNKWYPKNNLLGDVIGGIIVNGTKVPSVDPQGIYRSDNHAWLSSFKSASGKDYVVHLGPHPRMNLMQINEKDGYMVSKGVRGNDPYNINAANAFFAPGKMLKAGGAEAYGDTASSVGLAASNKSVVVDFSALPANPEKNSINVTNVPDMKYPRTFSNTVVLPGGRVLVIGGQSNIHIFQDETGILNAEIYDPKTNTWSEVTTPMKTPRNYHSFALLMPNGKVMAGGGGLCLATPGRNCSFKKSDVHFDAEIFTPDYLLNLKKNPQPIITKADVYLTIAKESHVKVQTKGCAGRCTFELIRASAATHTVNNDQIRIPLEIQKRSGSESYTVGIPAESRAFVQSGYYMMFAVSRKGVPSHASMVQVYRE